MRSAGMVTRQVETAEFMLRQGGYVSPSVITDIFRNVPRPCVVVVGEFAPVPLALGGEVDKSRALGDDRRHCQHCMYAAIQSQLWCDSLQCICSLQICVSVVEVITMVLPPTSMLSSDEVQRLLLPCKQPADPSAPDSIDLAAQKTLAALLKVHLQRWRGRAGRVASTRGAGCRIRSSRCAVQSRTVMLRCPCRH